MDTDTAHYKALLYSLQDDLTITTLKKNNHDTAVDVSAIDERVSTHNVTLELRDTDAYHERRRRIASPPYHVSYKGDHSLFGRLIIGIVGPRRPSQYASRVLTELFAQLAPYAESIATISGLADGVDRQCHDLSMQYGIPTIAVLGGGLGHYMTAPKHKSLIDAICDSGGMVISEFKLKKSPTPYTFPQRNRIIAGLCDRLFVPEAGQKSGSLVTVEQAHSIGRAIYGTPNSIFEPTSIGLNAAIGAGIVTPVTDISAFVAGQFAAQPAPTKSEINQDTPTITMPPLDLTAYIGDERMILAQLSDHGQQSFDQLVSSTGISAGALMTSLSMLQIKGVIHETSPSVYGL